MSSDPLDGVVPHSAERPLVPGPLPLSPAELAEAETPSSAQELAEQDAEYVTGIFDPESFGAGLRERNFKAAEIATTFVDILRTGNARDQIAAANAITKHSKDILKMSGGLVKETATTQITDADGNQVQATRSQTRLKGFLHNAPTSNKAVGVEHTPPLSKEDHERIQKAKQVSPAQHEEERTAGEDSPDAGGTGTEPERQDGEADERVGTHPSEVESEETE